MCKLPFFYGRSSIAVYCGFHRETIVKQKPKLISNVVFETPCIECGGVGLWDFHPEEPAEKCVLCKGTGKQLIGL